MAALFQPFALKSVVLRNRIAVAPMCQYSAHEGVPNDWHLVHLGARAVGGAGLVIAEATAVAPEGRISPGCTGLWNDAQIEPFARISQFVKERGAVPGVQLAHAGRKASANRPWEGDKHLTPDEGAWPIVGPSAVPFGVNLPVTPRELTPEEIAGIRQKFVAAARRAETAGFEWLELHFAHGYLASSFFSPIANRRTDSYGGSFDNRARFLLETLSAVRDVWPQRFPLTARLSVTDWVDGGVTVDESIELIRRFRERGLDLIDVSQGFNSPDISVIPWAPAFLAPIAARIRKETGLPAAVGWMIGEPELAEQVIREQQADLVMIARSELADPHWPFHAAKALGVVQPQQILPVQYAHWLKR